MSTTRTRTVSPNPTVEPGANCGTCGYAQNLISHNLLACRRYPPQAISNPGHPSRALVAFNDWCGEYSAGTPADPHVDLPRNTSIPYAGQEGAVVNCTMGNWTNTPDSYAWQWKAGATDIGTGGPSYSLTETDVGRVICCVVTATNAGGSVAAPPSNEVTVVAWT